MNLKILRTFAQLNVGIFLLLLIASFSILGTLIEQDQPINFYINSYSNFFLFNYFRFSQLILFFGIDHIYKTWWFLFLLFLFAFCLTICTYTQQFPILKFARGCNFKVNFNSFKNQEYFSILNSNFFSKCLLNFKFKSYNIFHQKTFVYAYKGILGRFAPIIVHFAMILILFGNTITAFGSFNSQELVAKGEIFHIQNLINKTFFSIIPDYPVRINDFWIDYGLENNIKQFYSSLSILNQNGDELIKKTISVNFPLQFNTLTFYQTDWNITGLRIFFNEKFYQLPILSLTKAKNFWISWIPSLNFEKKEITFITNNLNGNFSLYDKFGNFLGTFNLNDQIFDNSNLKIFEYITETGLQIKADPGIFFIYSGFLILMISILISYFSFTQFWLLKKQNKLYISATSNRAKLNLRIEFLKLTLPYLLN